MGSPPLFIVFGTTMFTVLLYFFGLLLYNSISKSDSWMYYNTRFRAPVVQYVCSYSVFVPALPFPLSARLKNTRWKEKLVPHREKLLGVSQLFLVLWWQCAKVIRQLTHRVLLGGGGELVPLIIIIHLTINSVLLFINVPTIYFVRIVGYCNKTSWLQQEWLA